MKKRTPDILLHIDLTPSKEEIPFNMTRRQFSVRLGKNAINNGLTIAWSLCGVTNGTKASINTCMRCYQRYNFFKVLLRRPRR